MTHTPVSPRALPAILVALLLSACAHAPQAIRLHPLPEAAPSGVGAGQALGVQVVDARTASPTADLPSATAARTQFPIQDDPVAVLRDGVASGLRHQGFQPAPGPGDPSITVRLTQFDYWVLKGIGTSDIRASVTLNAVAHRGTRSFDVTYKADQHQKVAVVPRRVDVQEAVNGALAAALSQLLKDNQLMQFLATDG